MMKTTISLKPADVKKDWVLIDAGDSVFNTLLSLAYPVREYIAQRQQIDQLLAQQQTMTTQVKALQAQNSKLAQTWYIEQEARDELHMCFPQEQCYEVVSGQPAKASVAKPQAVADPWYAKLWESVQNADTPTPK